MVQTVNILGSVGQMSSVATTQLCHCQARSMHGQYIPNGCGWCFTKTIYRNRQPWLTDHYNIASQKRSLTLTLVEAEGGGSGPLIVHPRPHSAHLSLEKDRESGQGGH